MIRTLTSAWLLVLAFVVLVAQQPEQPHEKYKDDPQAHCLAGPPLRSDTHGHECHCKMVCGPPDEHGQREMVEQADCELWCRAKRACLCHVDAGCDGLPMM